MANWKLHKYYRGVCIRMIRDRLNDLKACSIPLSDSDTHYLMKSITKTESTAKMDNKQFLEFIEEIWCIGAHLGIIIPDPPNNTMKELHKAIDLIEKARDLGLNANLIISSLTGSIDFSHFTEECPMKTIKTVRSYFSGSLTGYQTEYYTRFEDFNKEVEDYINSVANKKEAV